MDLSRISVRRLPPKSWRPPDKTDPNFVRLQLALRAEGLELHAANWPWVERRRGRFYVIEPFARAIVISSPTLRAVAVWARKSPEQLRRRAAEVRTHHQLEETR